MPILRKCGLALRTFGSNTRGAALVEFGISFPVLLLLFAVIVEGTRMFWSFQAAIDGVRDATRYVARAAPSNICSSGSLAGYTATLTDIVENSTNSGSVFDPLITVDSVTPALDCTVADAPMVDVSAQITIQLPFSAVFTLIGASALSDITAVVADRSRIFGT